jgi:phosphoenolpyruvate phosphomutase
MKALILNSGIGKRMGEHTASKCKCMVEIADGVTIIDEQIRRLLNCGIVDFCLTTGPFADALESYIRKGYPGVSFEYVNNPLFTETNYIYSIYLARESLRDDILLLHGDLVFSESVLQDVVSSTKSVMVVDTTKPLPPKDFKAVVKDGKVKYVGVDVFDNALYAQPLYKLFKDDWTIWLDEICRFCTDGNTSVYAENALNMISNQLNLYPLDVAGRSCFEIDDLDDLVYARSVYPKLQGE